MKNLFSTLLAVLPFIAWCQNEWQIGVFTTPEICFPNSRNTQSFVASNSGEYAPGYGISIGLTGIRKLNPLFEIQAGISISRPSYSVSLYENPSDPGTLYREVDMTVLYLDVPFSLNFLAGTGRLKFIAVGAIIPGIAMKRTSRVTNYNYETGQTTESKTSISDFPSMSINLLAEAGASYSVDKLTYRLAPAFRYGLVDYKSMYRSVNSYGIGLNFTVLYRLG